MNIELDWVNDKTGVVTFTAGVVFALAGFCTVSYALGTYDEVERRNTGQYKFLARFRN